MRIRRWAAAVLGGIALTLAFAGSAQAAQPSGPQAAVPSQGFAFNTTLGVDRDGTLLAASQQSSEVARIPGDMLQVVGPLVPASVTSPVGTPAGRYYVRAQGAQMPSLRLDPGGTQWLPDELDLERTVRAQDGTLFAIVNGEIVTFAAGGSTSDRLVRLYNSAMI